jgi:uncharacterized SAM-binding protein YcdF (DUF218 family)
MRLGTYDKIEEKGLYGMQAIFYGSYTYTLLSVVIAVVMTVVTTKIVSYVMALSIIVLQVNQPWLTTGYSLLLVLLMIPVMIIGILGAFLFILNGIIVWRRESHTLGNLLTLMIGILLMVIPIVFQLLNRYIPNNQIILFMEKLGYSLQKYVIFWILAFLASYLLTKIVKPPLNQDYAIVLGAGLLAGSQVSPLLGSRIMAAVKFKNKQAQQTGKPMVLIMSGGKGSDEQLPEAEAMKIYAVTKGVPEQDILVENQSKNTYQNMLFSKQLVLEHHLNPQKGIFATNDYHVFRAAGFARLVGLQIDGIGAKTSGYFLPNAMIREYVAILLTHKKFHYRGFVVNYAVQWHNISTVIKIVVSDGKTGG